MMDFKTLHHRQRGMTLLELLVVMTLLALVTSLLMQGFATALSTYERVQRRQNEGMPLELGYGWFTQTVSGAQAEIDPPRHFKGDAEQFAGTTHNPLLGSNGQVSFFSWQLSEAQDGKLQLTYSQPGKVEWVVANWPPGSRGRFIYRSQQGSPVEQWPDSASNATITPADGRLPSAILLEITPIDGPPIRWYANLPGRPFPRPDYRDF
jgi:general secretion pathway protein J